MALIVNGAAPSSSVAAADITDATAAGRAVLTAANAAAQGTALGAAALTPMMTEAIGAQDAGTAIIADGAGALGITSGDVSAVLAAANNAAIRSAIGAGTSNYATPTEARGDIIRRGASADERVALGTTGYVLTAGATDPAWAAPTVTASQITDSTAAGRSLLTAADAAAQLSALGLGQPTTLRGQAALAARLRTGPLVMAGWSDSDYVGALTAPAGAAQPSIVRGSSGVVVVYSPSAGGYASTHLAASHNVGPGTRGWIVTALGSDLGLYSISDTTAVAMVGAVASVGWHAASWSISAGGAVRVSVDGGAIQTPAGTPAFTARSGDAVRIGRGVLPSVASPVWISDLAIVSSVLPDADLQTLSGSASTGLPGTIATASAWEWAAGAHAGQQRVTIDGVTYAIVGAPQLWVP